MMQWLSALAFVGFEYINVLSGDELFLLFGCPRCSIRANFTYIPCGLGHVWLHPLWPNFLHPHPLWFLKMRGCTLFVHVNRGVPHRPLESNQYTPFISLHGIQSPKIEAFPNMPLVFNTQTKLTTK